MVKTSEEIQKEMDAIHAKGMAERGETPPKKTITSRVSDAAHKVYDRAKDTASESYETVKEHDFGKEAKTVYKSGSRDARSGLNTFTKMGHNVSRNLERESRVNRMSRYRGVYRPSLLSPPNSSPNPIYTGGAYSHPLNTYLLGGSQQPIQRRRVRRRQNQNQITIVMRHDYSKQALNSFLSSNSRNKVNNSNPMINLNNALGLGKRRKKR